MAEDAERPYDLAVAPLMRAKVLRLAAEDHVILLNFHHAVCDGSSLAIFYRELAAFYDALARGRALALPRLPVQYADFALWQQRALGRGLFAAQANYWRRQLGGHLLRAELPSHRRRPALPTYRGAKVAERLSREVTSALQRLARGKHATLFMVLLAALKILLARLTGGEDVVVGATIAGRNHAELDDLIGFFINVLPLRTDLSGNPSFCEILDRVAEVCLDGYAHQDLPFEGIVGDLSLRRDTHRSPIFQVLFNMAEIAGRELELRGCVATRLNRTAVSAKFDLVVLAPQVDGRLELTLVYNADMFDPAQARAMLDQWTHLLEQISLDPERKLDQFSLVPAAARAVLPDPTEALDERWHGPIHAWVARRAEARPDSTAVSDGREQWSYRELDRISNRLARHLIAAGIKEKDAVAVYANRDASLPLALLGILKAGAAFALLDPAYPAARLVDYLRAARPSGLLRMEEAGPLAAQIETQLESGGARVRCHLPRAKTNILRALGRRADGPVHIARNATDPAYIAFTSGSTGAPKGVLCRHGPMTHFLPWQEETFDLRSSDRYGLLSGLGYNHLHRDVFTALGLGARLCVPAEEDLRDPQRLALWLQAQKISVLHITPALGRFLHAAETKLLPAVRRVFFGGDVLSEQDVARMRAMTPNAYLASFYGATETQRAVGYFILPPHVGGRDPEAQVPIGKGAPGVQLLLLTANRGLAGIGEIGELCIRSPHLAAGYCGDAELSRANFIANPFTDDPRDRLYRTRESGRYLPDGNIVWLGRNDRRVGIRGFRVDLAEIESVLAQCAGVRCAAVLARESPTADGETLIAYIEPEATHHPQVETLRDFLGARLPHYMIPSRFNLIERMPLNPSGKIDYTALAPETGMQTETARAMEAPATELERMVAGTFAEILQLGQIGRREDFFALGGHSLLAAKAVARVRDVLKLPVDLRTLLECPTVEAFCRRIEAGAPPGEARGALSGAAREEIEL
jgi:amino acid adenylation domain-containing protein